jgi:hypothetical protein
MGIIALLAIGIMVWGITGKLSSTTTSVVFGGNL